MAIESTRNTGKKRRRVIAKKSVAVAVSGTGKEASWGKCREISVPRQTSSCWQVLHKSLVVLGTGKATPTRASHADPVSPRCIAPHLRQGNHEPHLIPSCPIMALVRYPTSPAVSVCSRHLDVPSHQPSLPHLISNALLLTSPSIRRPTCGLSAGHPADIPYTCRVHVDGCHSGHGEVRLMSSGCPIACIKIPLPCFFTMFRPNIPTSPFM
jgi:hypothetical protein